MVDGEISFGRFRFDLTRRELQRDNSRVRLGNRALDILCVLASAEGALVTKDELMAQVWPGVVVEENNLHFHISSLRKALDADGEGESWIVTVPGRGYRLLRPPEPPAAGKAAAEASAGQPSLAVLPFNNLSGDPEQEYFADGMVEEIITTLSRIHWLFVIARNSSFTYKGRTVDIKQVGRELGVLYVLEGSVRKAGNRVRITAQLLDATTAAHLWADHFDGTLEDIFQLQDNVASSVAGVIEPTMLAAEHRRSTQRPTNDLTAYDLYLQAHALSHSWEREATMRALDLLGRALNRDAHYGLALAQAAFLQITLDGNYWSEDQQRNRQDALDLARRALQALGDNPEVLGYAGHVLGYFEADIDTAITLIDRA